MADLDRQQEPSQLKRINSKPKTSGLAEEKEQSKQSGYKLYKMKHNNEINTEIIIIIIDVM